MPAPGTPTPDLEGWVAAFTDDGTFTDEYIGVTDRGPEELSKTVDYYARAFPDIHRELYRMYVTGDLRGRFRCVL